MATKEAFAAYNRNQRVLKLDPEACRLLDELAPSARRRGRFVSNLILQEHARRQERARIATQLIAETPDDDAA